MLVSLRLQALCLECVKQFGPRPDTFPEVAKAAAREVAKEAAERMKPLTDMLDKMFGN